MPLTLAQRSPNGPWYIRGTVAVGKETRSVYESTRLRDKKLAERYRRKREAEIVSVLLEGPRTFAEAAKAYDDYGGSLKFTDRLSKHFGKRDLATIKQADLEAAGRKLYPKCSPETVNRQAFTPFIAVWNYAAVNEWVPMRKWLRPRKLKGTKLNMGRPVRAGSTPVSYDRAVAFVSGMSPAPAMVMTALFFTGMRPIELFSLQAPDVYVQGRWIVISHSKTGEPRGVPMHEFLVPLFESLLKRQGIDRDPIVFRTHKGEPYPLLEDGGGQLKGAINGARLRTKIRDISPYTARHTVSTQLVINGVHPHIKDQILGHAVDDMSRHYTNVPQQPLIDAINTIAVPDAWRRLSWIEDPLSRLYKLVEGTGRRREGAKTVGM